MRSVSADTSVRKHLWEFAQAKLHELGIFLRMNEICRELNTCQVREDARAMLRKTCAVELKFASPITLPRGVARPASPRQTESFVYARHMGVLPHGRAKSSDRC